MIGRAKLQIYTALATFLLAADVGAQSSERLLVHAIEVVNELGRGVEAEIRMVDTSDKDTHFAYTDNKGASRPNRNCSIDARFMARPKINIYRKPRKLPYCASDVRIVLQRAGVAEYLAEKGDAAVGARDYRLATMLYAESAFRLEDTNPVRADHLRDKALTTFQQGHPGIRLVTFDTQQDKYVLSTEGVLFLKGMQSRGQLPPTGQLDLRTLQSLSGQPIFPYIKDAYKGLQLRPFDKLELQDGQPKPSGTEGSVQQLQKRSLEGSPK